MAQRHEELKLDELKSACKAAFATTYKDFCPQLRSSHYLYCNLKGKTSVIWGNHCVAYDPTLLIYPLGPNQYPSLLPATNFQSPGCPEPGHTVMLLKPLSGPGHFVLSGVSE